MMSCSKEVMLSEFIDGQLSEKDAQEIREHLLNCKHCAKVYEELKALNSLFHYMRSKEEIKGPSFEESLMATRKILQSIRKEDPPADDGDSTITPFPKKKTKIKKGKSFVFPLSIAASVILLGVVSTLVLHNLGVFQHSDLVMESSPSFAGTSVNIAQLNSSGPQGDTVILPDTPTNAPEIEPEIEPEISDMTVARKINELLEPPAPNTKTGEDDYLLQPGTQETTIANSDMGFADEGQSAEDVPLPQQPTKPSVETYIAKFNEALENNHVSDAISIIATAKQNYPEDTAINQKYEEALDLEKDGLKTPVELQVVISQRFYPADFADAGSSVKINYTPVTNEYGETVFAYDPNEEVIAEQLDAADHIDTFRQQMIDLVTSSKVKGIVVNRLSVLNGSDDILIVDIPQKNLAWFMSVLKTHGDAKELLGPDSESDDMESLDTNEDGMVRMHITLDISQDISQ